MTVASEAFDLHRLAAPWRSRLKGRANLVRRPGRRSIPNEKRKQIPRAVNGNGRVGAVRHPADPHGKRAARTCPRVSSCPRATALHGAASDRGLGEDAPGGRRLAEDASMRARSAPGKPVRRSGEPRLRDDARSPPPRRAERDSPWRPRSRGRRCVRSSRPPGRRRRARRGTTTRPLSTRHRATVARRRSLVAQKQARDVGLELAEEPGVEDDGGLHRFGEPGAVRSRRRAFAARARRPRATTG